MRLAEPSLVIARRSNDPGVRDVQRMLIGAVDEWSTKSLLALITQNHLHAECLPVLDLGD